MSLVITICSEGNAGRSLRAIVAPLLKEKNFYVAGIAGNAAAV